GAAIRSVLTGQTLVLSVAGCAVIAVLASARGRRPLAVAYGLAAGVFLAISVALVTWLGFARPGDPGHTLWVYAAYTVISFSAAGRLRTAIATAAGCLMLLMTAADYFVYVSPLTEYAWPTTLLIVSSACAMVGAVLGRLHGRDRELSDRIFSQPITLFSGAMS